jgi:3-oxoacyl-[acyl-carrier protein] reductase
MKKNYLIVGGSSGIGFSLVEKLLKDDNKVIVLARQERNLPKDQNLSFISCDVIKSDLPALPEALDGLVYLPGSITLKPFTSLKREDFLHDFEINVLGAVKCISHYLANLKQVKGSIVLMSSVAATKGFSFHASIGSAKASVEALTRSLAAEFAPNLRVNAIAPSLTQTPLASFVLTNQDKIDTLGKKHPLQRLGRADDISNIICYLLSDKASWITGQVIHVDGGLSTLSM